MDGEPARVVASRQVGGGRRAIKLDRVVERGAELALPREQLPALLPDSYYVADLVGMDVLDEQGVRVGVVRDVLPGPANDVLELDSGLLLPLVEDCIREVDLAGPARHSQSRLHGLTATVPRSCASTSSRSFPTPSTGSGAPSARGGSRQRARAPHLQLPRLDAA